VLYGAEYIRTVDPRDHDPGRRPTDNDIDTPLQRIRRNSNFSVPGQGAEASLGKYSFQVTTPIPGTASASPTPGVNPSSGYFIVMPDTQPTAEVGSGSTVRARLVNLSAGSQLYIWFSGYPSFSTVYVSLYGPCAAQECPWLADLPGVRADQYGEGTASWAIPSSAAASLYPIWIDPAPTCLNPCIALSVTG
jgi:hypothetical protein